MIHTVKGFCIVNKAEIDVFLELSCFFHDSVNVGNLISGFSAFSKPSLYIWKFLGHILLKPILKDFEHKLTSMWNECNYTVVWTFFGLHPGLCIAGEEKTHRDTVRKALEISSLPLTLLNFQESQGKYKILCDPIQTWLWIASFPPFPHYTLQTFLVWSQKDPKLFCPSDIFAHWLQLCPTLWDLMDCGLPGTSVCGIFQARILEWVALSSSRGSSQPSGLPRWLSDKESICQCRRWKDTGSVPGWGRSPGGGNANRLQYSCLENSTSRGAWQSTVRGATKSQTQLSFWALTQCDLISTNYICPDSILK